jgi:MFS family permease
MLIYFTFAIALLNITSVQASRVLLTLYALKFGAQPFAVGILAAMFSVSPMLLSWQVGKLSDRFGSRWPLMFGAASGACGMLAPYFFPGLPMLYIAGVMNGLLFAFIFVPLQNLVGLQSEAHNRLLNFNNFSLVLSVASFLGPLFAGFSIDHAGHAITCLYVGLLSLIPAAMLAIWGGALPRGSRKAQPKGGVRDMLTGSGLQKVLVASCLVTTGVTLFQFYMPVYGHGIGLSASAIGVVLAMYPAAAFAVRLVLPNLISRLSEQRVLAYAFFLGAISFMLVPLFKTHIVLALVAFAFGLGMGCGQPITLMLTFSSSAEGRSGEVLGVRLTLNHMTALIVPVIFGSIGSMFGLLPVFWINALVLASGGAMTRSGTISKRTGE